MYSAGQMFSTLAEAQAWVESNARYSSRYPTSGYSILRINKPGCTGGGMGFMAGNKYAFDKIGQSVTCVESGTTNQITSAGATRIPSASPSCL